MLTANKRYQREDGKIGVMCIGDYFLVVRIGNLSFKVEINFPKSH